MKFEFDPGQWHHGYLGILILLINLKLRWRLLWIIAAILIIDELTQIFIFGQYGGLLHRLYRHLWKIEWIRKLNQFLDKLFGKIFH